MKSIILLFTLFIGTICRAQVSYLPLSLNEAIGKARSEGKLVLLQFESKDCQQCNEVADKGMSDKKLATLVNQTFIPIKIKDGHPDRNTVISQFNMDNTFGTLFIDGAGTLIHKMLSSSTAASLYFQNIDIALIKASEGLKVSLLEKEYREGNRSLGFVEALLLKKQTLNLATQDLLDEYVNLLPADSLISIRTLVFIAKMAPLLNSPAHYALRKNAASFNVAWYSLPLTTRVSINNRIIYNSMQKAIATKDEPYALRTAEFAMKTQDANRYHAVQTYERQLLRYYYGIAAKEKYLDKAITYYNRHLMGLNPDSILAKEKMMKQEIFAATPVKDTVRTSPTTYTIRKQVAYKPYGQPFSAELTEAAISVYKLTEDEAFLRTATEWAKRAILLYKSPEALDIYAKLLYKQKQTSAAIETQMELVALRSKRGFPTEENEALLQRMKRGETLD